MPPEEFEKWKRSELRSRDIVIWIGFGWFAIEILVLVPLIAFSSGSPGALDYVCPVMLLALPAMLIALVVSAIFGSMARSIKNKYNIQLR